MNGKITIVENARLTRTENICFAINNGSNLNAGTDWNIIGTENYPDNIL